MQAMKTFAQTSALTLALALALAGHAAANEAAPPHTAEDSAARADDERMVCERRKAIGSNKAERICKTARQWREERDSAQSQSSKRTTDRAFEKRNVCASANCTNNLNLR